VNRARSFFFVCAGILLVSFAEAKDPTKAPPSGSVVASPLDDLTSGEKERLRDILRLVGKPDVRITPVLRREFWGLMEKGGRLTPSDVATVKDLMFGAATVYMRLFYEDAIEAYKTRQPFKSLEREQYEKRLLKLGVMSEFRVAQNGRLMEQIAAHQPVSTAEGDVLMDSTSIRSILANLSVAGQRMNLLFTRPQ
jgi:hypothetical protein